MNIFEEEEHPLLTVPGFLELYSKHLKPNISFKSAYEAAEVEFIKIYNHRRYKNWKTFMNSRNQYLKIKRKKIEDQKQAA